MGINKESDISASLQIGPTDLGMVRIYVEGEGFELPMDFDPDEAADIVEELQAAIEAARAIGPAGPPSGGGQGTSFAKRGGKAPTPRPGPRGR